MNILKRVGYYLGGFALGLILLAVFLKGSGTSIPSCDYGPTARTLKNIRTKNLVYAAPYLMQDSALVQQALLEGDVRFRESEPRGIPCPIYQIIYEISPGEQLNVKVQNCDSTATVQEINRLR
ncbi:hypothetical protein [Croceiramulus getboli]|nr:hypothetical protein P8624_11615 [Flavobacteriaceae bacterium YJPT1-3]